MFESIFNYIFIFIPIAIFVGRIVSRAKTKRSPPPPRSAPRIPVHFEDDADENPARAAGKEAPPKEALPPAKAAPKAPIERQPPAAQKQGKPGLLNLANLSPLKQAVVMAEILGPPKALQ